MRLSNVNYQVPPTASQGGGKGQDPARTRWGVFGQINQSTSFASIKDGTSNTIITGELQRILSPSPPPPSRRGAWS